MAYAYRLKLIPVLLSTGFGSALTGELERHIAGSRPQIESTHARLEPDPVQQRARGRGPEPREHLEPFVADLATLDDVVLFAVVHGAL